MDNFVIEIKSQTASFRNPNFQNFHKTLKLPPPTTIMGLAGAALGLSPLQAQDFFEKDNFKIGVYGTFEGICNDTWKYNKLTKDLWKHRSWSKLPHLFKKKKDIAGGVLIKEYLVGTRFLLAFSCSNKEKLEELFSAFNSPAYALTMGNSDSLALVKSVIQDLGLTKSYHVEHSMIQGDVVNEVMRLAPEKMEFSIYQTAEPMTYDLPIRFEYKSDYGKRAVSSISTFSLIRKKMKLNFEVEGLSYQDIFIPLFKL